jgi:excisionase family DNA binding protein
MEESMSRAGRPRNHEQVYRRPNTTILSLRYRDRGGRIRRESTATADWNEAERFLRDRPDARDDGKLAAVLSRKNVTLREAAEAAQFLGVSRQTVYLWVERKQIPHLRVMGRNIRFLQSDLEPFRAQYKQEVVDGKTQ